MAFTYFKAEQVKDFFMKGNLIYRQIKMDSLESDDTLPFSKDLSDKDITPEGDFSDANTKQGTKIDIEKLNDIIKWVREKLNLNENELRFVSKGGGFYIQVDDKVKNRVNEFLSNHHKNSNSINMTADVIKEAFYTQDTYDKSNLSPKGLTIIQDYYAEKDKLRNDTFICEDIELPEVFNKLAKAKDGVTINIIYRAGGSHWVPLQCQKRDGKYYLIEMDSLGTYRDKNLPPKNLILPKHVLKSVLKEQDVTLLRAQNQRQTAPNNCGFFSLKDARKMQNNPRLLQDVIKHKTTNASTVLNGVKLAYYLTPVEHMNVVQSRTAITQYVKKHNEIIRQPQITEEQVLAASFSKVKKSTKSRVELTGKDKQSKVISMVKDKYMAHVADTKISTSPLSTLANIVGRYNANDLTVDRINQTVDAPRNLSQITPDPEEIITIEATLPTVKEAATMLGAPTRPSQDASTDMTKQVSRAQPVLTKPPVQTDLTQKQMSNLELLNHFKEKINNIVLDNTVGQLTKGALEKIKNCAKIPAVDQTQARSGLLELKKIVINLNLDNIKSTALKSLLNEIKVATIKEAPTRAIGSSKRT